MSDDPELAAVQVQIRRDRLQYIEQSQFYLAYLSNIGIAETDSMSVAEFNNLHQILLDQKKFEKEEREKAMKAAKAKKGRS